MSLVARPQPSPFASVLPDLVAVCLRVCLFIEASDPLRSTPTGNKKPRLSGPGSKIETSDLLAGCLTWPQAGRLKSPRSPHHRTGPAAGQAAAATLDVSHRSNLADIPTSVRTTVAQLNFNRTIVSIISHGLCIAI